MKDTSLPTSFYTIPHFASVTMTRKAFKSVLLLTDGWIMARGECWDIIGKHIGVGVYRVSLKKKNL